MKEIPLASLSLYEFQCDLDLTTRIYNEIQELDKTKKLQWKPGQASNQNHSTIGTLYQPGNPAYYDKELFNWFQDCVSQVTNTIFEKKVIITETWLTKTTFSQYMIPHCHTYSVMSGVFYFSPTKNSSIKFFYRHPEIDKFGFLYQSIMEDSTRKEIIVNPDKGKLVLFPSHLTHAVMTNNTFNEVRYSLAFNTFFTGSLGDGRSALLEIDSLGPEKINKKLITDAIENQ